MYELAFDNFGRLNMNTRTILLVGVCLLLFVGESFSQGKQKAQELRALTVSTPKPPPGVIPPRQDSTVLVVKSSIPNLRLESNLGERVKKVGEGVWHMYLSPEPQIISFNAAGYKQLKQEYRTFERNRAYEVQVKAKKGSKTLWWVIGGAAAAGGAFAALSGGGGGGNGTTTQPEKLPDPPGGPTGN
jgi:hypothetical protein